VTGLGSPTPRYLESFRHQLPARSAAGQG
jgi:hypothetical protein